MVSKACEKMLDDMMAEIFEYKPNPIESLDLFLKRKRQIYMGWQTKNIKNVEEGLEFFSKSETENERIKGLLEKFLNLGQILDKECEGKDSKTLAQNFEELNIFGLNKEDYGYMIELTKKIYESGNYLQASRMYQAVTMLFPEKLDSWLNWGSVEYAHFFDYNSVLRIYEECLRIFKDPFVYYCMALCHIKGNELNLAKDSLEQSIKRSDEIGDTEIKEKAEKILADIAPFAR